MRVRVWLCMRMCSVCALNTKAHAVEEIMGHEAIWNSHPKGKSSQMRRWCVRTWRSNARVAQVVAWRVSVVLCSLCVSRSNVAGSCVCVWICFVRCEYATPEKFVRLTYVSIVCMLAHGGGMCMCMCVCVCLVVCAIQRVA